jgi:RHS repeat-associated protein
MIYPIAETGLTRLKEKFEYDALGRIKKIIDTANRKTIYNYDDTNRTISVTNAELETTQTKYNARRQAIEVKDALNQIYTFTYNPFGQILTQTRGGTTMNYVYDEVGNRIRRSDYLGRITNYVYDNLNRLERINYIGVLSFEGGNPTPINTAIYNYDDLSRLTGATNEIGTVAFTYDNRNRQTSTTDVFGHLVEYGYDAASNRNQLKLDGGVHTAYVYDDANRLITLTDEANQNFTFGYDFADRLISKTLPNSIATTYNYDGMNRLKGLKHQSSTATLFDNQYSYNTANQISQIAELTQTKNYTYDNVNRLTGMTSGAAIENYTFDDVGNRNSSHRSPTYNYQPFNKLTSTATANYNYDANGNMVSKAEGTNFWRYGFDYENRLVSASTRKQTVRYRYDALGRRVQRYLVGNKENTKFIYDGLDVVADDNAGVLTKYQNGLGIDNKLKVSSGGVSKYFLQDHLGSTVGLTNSSGAITEQTAYDSFGNATNNLTTRYQFTGREYDNFTGLHYYRARFYDANLGRFISEDPIGFRGGDVNLFGYVRNNPMLYVDREGESPTLVTGAIGAGVGALIGGGYVLLNGGSWTDAGKGAAVGAIAGGVTGLTLGFGGAAIAGVFNGGILGGAAAGAVGAAAGNLAAQGFQLAVGWKCEFSFRELGYSSAFGALTGGLLLRPYTAPQQTVTSWASKGNTPDLNSGRWVMTGGATLGNYLRTVGPATKLYPFGNSATGTLPAGSLQSPTGFAGNLAELLGQRIIR